MVDYYGNIAGARSYWLDRGVDLSFYDDAKITVSLVSVSEYIDLEFQSLFPGYKKGLRAQVREWPRYDAFDKQRNSIPDTEIPLEVINASYELLFRYLTDETVLDNDYVPNKYKSVSVEGAISVVYNGLDATDSQTVFVKVNQILDPVLSGRGAAYTGMSGEVFRR